MASALPLRDATVDVAVSVFGVIFADDAPAVAAELARVAAPTARIVLTAWVPGAAMAAGGGVQQQAVLQALGVPPVIPFAWHAPTALADLLGPHGFAVTHLASLLILHHALAVTGAGASADTVVDADGGPGAFGLNLDGQANQRVSLKHLTVTGSTGRSAIDMVFATLTLEDVDVRDNANTSGPGLGLGGGLLLITHATANVVDSTFAGNGALAGGAIAMAQDGTDDHVAVEGSELTGNRAFARTGGGAILAGFGDIDVHANRLHANIALTGGALASYPDATLQPTSRCGARRSTPTERSRSPAPSPRCPRPRPGR